MIIRTRHLHSARWCAKGARAWFALYQLSWSRFVREGLDEAELAATGDALALRLIAHAHRVG